MSPISLAVFPSAAPSFCPASFPMASGFAASTSRALFSNRASTHSSDSLIPQSMDPHPTDPNVLFIHPPFNFFPNSHLSPDGLTYNVMAENPEWFLDPNDFVSANNTDPDAVSYPPYLEPPRGWCPAKKKDLKERGAEGWPEGEAPRLRCTFCRRTYAGVNAKSMWRRHVFEKHKIAMSNRRDGNSDRPRGRGSGKENKQVVSVKTRDSHDGLISIIVTPQTAPDTLTHKSRFRSAKCSRKRDQQRQGSTPLTPRQSKTSFSEDDSDSDVHVKTVTPPLTPQAEESSDPPNVFGSDGTTDTSPILSCPPPESPYNPLRTPSFRHSPPRLPSYQPWRFPSPSHPLHSNTRELSLTVLARLQGTPLVKGETTVIESPIQSSSLSTTVDWDVATPASSTSLAKSRKRAHLIDLSSSPLSAVSSSAKRQRIMSSPLPFSTRRTTKGHNRHPSDSEFWFSDERLVPSRTLVPVDPSLADSLAIYDSWPLTSGVPMTSPVRPPKRPMEMESPIVRNGSLASLTSDLGSHEGVPPIEDVDDDLREILLSSPAVKDDRGSNNKQIIPVVISSWSSPPSKKRKTMPIGSSRSFL